MKKAIDRRALASAMRKTFLTIIAAMTLSAGSGMAASRMWTDTQGRKVSAEFISMTGETLSLRTDDGRVFELALSRLSAPDQAVAHTLAKTTAAPASAPASGATAGAIPVPKSTQESAAIIDKLVDFHLAQNKLKANPPLTDEQFVRRIYLDAVGRIPNHDETVSFLQDKSGTKREKLIKSLLKMNGHYSHLFNYYADMLRLKTQPDEFVSGASYVQWVKDCIEKNMPYDEMVRQMLTATGTSWENPAAGYLLRDAGMPLDNLSLTMQVFTGLDLSCAQCHDHPFAEWTQLQFYKMAAFFGETTSLVKGPMAKTIYPKSKGNPVKRIEDELKAKGDYPEPDRLMRNMIRTHSFRVVDDPKNLKLQLPFDYKYKDGKPDEVVTPGVLYGKMPTLESYDTRRKAFAAWLTGPENERFAITIANRMWKRAFGRGLADPVNSCEDYNETVNPQLIRFLGSEMRRLNFNLQAFDEIIYNTKAYQRQATTTAIAMGTPYHFQGPLLRRMTAEQIWDSFLTMNLADADYFYRKRDYMEWENILATKSVDDMTGVEARDILSTQVKDLRAAPGGTYGWPTVEFKADENKIFLDERLKAYRINNSVLIRASEFQQPASAGLTSFLREMGQSDRMLIDGGALNGSVPITLVLMNSPGTRNLTRPGSRILEAIEKGKAIGPKLEIAFLSILNRMPDQRERSLAYKAISHDGTDGFKNVVWALINSREFFFIQ
jgi:hypothetical protein